MGIVSPNAAVGLSSFPVSARTQTDLNQIANVVPADKSVINDNVLVGALIYPSKTMYVGDIYNQIYLYPGQIATFDNAAKYFFYFRTYPSTIYLAGLPFGTSWRYSLQESMKRDNFTNNTSQTLVFYKFLQTQIDNLDAYPPKYITYYIIPPGGVIYPSATHFKIGPAPYDSSLIDNS